MKKEIEKLINTIIEIHGVDNLKAELHSILGSSDDENTLTIIANAGIHPTEALHNRGTVYIASTGSLDFSSKESSALEIKNILYGVAKVLKSKKWKKVILVPFGPSVLSMNIKMLVYKILYINTIDVLHAGNGIHYDINVDHRKIAENAPQKD
ncbi:MAG: hypothetical protein KJ914_03825 [Gammaproteobacteria bacterium]|nr:hypothetical protein [Gammaproteobacteria bacterium]MBU1722666.1 hypothetical protein [Gammaproteobacteria bacterium]MBU2006713.1 hypothetical protein [Gammaproteobacteria bacterium]